MKHAGCGHEYETAERMIAADIAKLAEAGHGVGRPQGLFQPMLVSRRPKSKSIDQHGVTLSVEHPRPIDFRRFVERRSTAELDEPTAQNRPVVRQFVRSPLT
jgi:hypothetical protein